VPGNLVFIPATLVPLISLKHQTYHLFSTRFLTVQTLPGATPNTTEGKSLQNEWLRTDQRESPYLYESLHRGSDAGLAGST